MPDTPPAPATDDQLDQLRQRRNTRIARAQQEIADAEAEYDQEIARVGGHLVDAAA